MIPDVVVDIGNSRMKWGHCIEGRVAEMVSLPLDDPCAWEDELAKQPPPRAYARQWAIASVNEPALLRFMGWNYSEGGTAVIEYNRFLPLRVQVDEPESVGIDRLMNAVAAHHFAGNRPAVTVGIGTAVIADLVDESGAFLGGAILPGPQLMARSLHEHTAKLPLVDASNLHAVSCPGYDTRRAIELGISSAVGGAIARLIAAYSQLAGSPPVVCFTGGGMGPFTDIDDDELWTPDPADTHFVPTLTLEGIRIAAEALP
jgi:type III pantothenate kinase